MSVENVSGVKPVLTQAPSKKEVEQKISQAEKEIKDGKKKIALALAGLATAGIATAGIVYGIKTGKFAKAQQEVQEQGQKAVEKIKGLVKGDDIPFEKNKIESTTIKKHKLLRDNKTGKLLGEKTTELDVEKEIIGKFNAKYDGKDVVVEEKLILSPKASQTGAFAFIRDKESGELISAKKINPNTEKEIPMLKFKKSQGIYRATEQLTDNAGNQIQKTFKNGKLYSTQTTILNPDGSKRIVIDYAYGKESPIMVQTPTSTEVRKPKGQTIIDIAADGTKTVVQKAKNAFEM